MSSAARQSSARSSEPSGLMSHSMPGQQADAEPSGVERADARGVRERAALVEAVGHGERLAVIGDRDVFEPRLPRRHRHRPDVVLAVRLGGVHVEVAAEIGALDQAGQRARRGGVDLAAHLAQLRRHPVEAERGVDVLFALAGDAAVVRDAEQAVFVQLEAEADRAVAQRDVVRLGSGEVLQRGAAALGRHEPQVGLEPALEEDARLRLAVAEHALDRRVGDEVVHQRGPARRWRAGRDRRRSRSRAAGCRPPRSSAGRALAQVLLQRGRRPRAPWRADGGRRSACARRAPSGSALPSWRPSPSSRESGRRRRPFRDRRATGHSDRGRASRPSSARRPAAAAGRGSSAANSAMRSRCTAVSPVSAISRMRAARSLPMPGISRRPVSSSRARSCGWLPAMSAPLR